MPFNAAVIREALRLRPIVPAAMRRAGRDIQLPGGAVIPSGCPVAIAFSSMAEREPAWQADWSEFRPERFLAEGGGGLAPQPATFNPFGIGQR